MRRLTSIALSLLLCLGSTCIAAPDTPTYQGSITSPSQFAPGSAIGNTGSVARPTATANPELNPFGKNVAQGMNPSTATIGTQVDPVMPLPQDPAAAFQPRLDYSANLRSDVYGAQLFSGNFARQGAIQFNPDYLITAGDRLQVRLWGGFNFDALLLVDHQGNIFLPQVGPVKVMGVRNQELQKIVESAVRKVFRANVYCYASLAAAQPVRVFVGGNVNRPGLYNGTSMDSLLYFLDIAGGIDPERGTFLNVEVKRGATMRASINLYDFMLQGKIPLTQLSDGDVIFVPARQNIVRVTGLADNQKRFEFSNSNTSVKELSLLAKPDAQATHVRIIRNSGSIKNVEHFPLAKAHNITVSNGDEVEFTADKKPGTITVRVEGEHQSPQEYVLPYGARLGTLIKKIQFNERSEMESIQLFRKSVGERQKSLLMTALRSLESAALTARSGTNEEAQLRKTEAEIMLQWVERAKKIEPTGQVMISQATNRDELLLENGDIIKVPARDGLVLVSGEVLFPNSIAYNSGYSIEDYINRSGGYTQNADTSRIIVAHRDGSFEDGSSNPTIRAGDTLMALPKVDTKSRQIWKEMIQIIYQIAVTSRIVLNY